MKVNKKCRVVRVRGKFSVFAGNLLASTSLCLLDPLLLKFILFLLFCIIWKRQGSHLYILRDEIAR